MTREFTTYNQALALKELGYNEPCLAWYVSKDYGLEIGKVIQTDLIKDAIVAPTFHQAFRFFSEKHNLHGCVDLHVSNPTHWYIRIDNIVENDYLYHSEDENLKFKTYEEAELACLKKLIEICKNK